MREDSLSLQNTPEPVHPTLALFLWGKILLKQEEIFAWANSTKMTLNPIGEKLSVLKL